MHEDTRCLLVVARAEAPPENSGGDDFVLQLHSGDFNPHRDNLAELVIHQIDVYAPRREKSFPAEKDFLTDQLTPDQSHRSYHSSHVEAFVLGVRGRLVELAA